MKKLIKLLNEWLKYEENFGPDKLTRVAGVDYSGELIFNLKNGCYWKVEYVISKRCGFIKWLVQNDKIDLEEFYSLCGIINQDSEYWNGTPQDYEQVIMYLSISDYPIEDLISLLRTMEKELEKIRKLLIMFIIMRARSKGQKDDKIVKEIKEVLYDD